jgi:hypothetical protein
VATPGQRDSTKKKKKVTVFFIATKKKAHHKVLQGQQRVQAELARHDEGGTMSSAMQAPTIGKEIRTVDDKRTASIKRQAASSVDQQVPTSIRWKWHQRHRSRERQSIDRAMPRVRRRADDSRRQSPSHRSSASRARRSTSTRTRSRVRPDAASNNTKNASGSCHGETRPKASKIVVTEHVAGSGEQRKGQRETRKRRRDDGLQAGSSAEVRVPGTGVRTPSRARLRTTTRRRRCGNDWTPIPIGIEEKECRTGDRGNDATINAEMTVALTAMRFLYAVVAPSVKTRELRQDGDRTNDDEEHHEKFEECFDQIVGARF